MALYLDRELHERFQYVTTIGQEIFTGSAIVDSARRIERSDIDLIFEFYKATSPVNPSSPWRVVARPVESFAADQIVDTSSFGTWEQPSGMLEHLLLTSQAAEFLVRRLGIEDQVDPLYAAAAGALHDPRLFTHLFYPNEIIGRRLLLNVGVRPEIINAMPKENLFLNPTHQALQAAINSLPLDALLVRFADQFAKRVKGTDRIPTLEEVLAFDSVGWGKANTDRADSRRPSDAWWISQLPIHLANVSQFFTAINARIEETGNLSVRELSVELNQELSPALRRLA
jgi:hypothetical protein